MRFVIQRVLSASVKVENQIVGQIDSGLLIFVAFHVEDRIESFQPAITKICDLRIFAEGEKSFHLSLNDLQKDVLIVSQFTLYADCKKGRRPSLNSAMSPDRARSYYDRFVADFKQNNKGKVETGHFGAHMEVSLVNDGPVTLIIESESLQV